MSDEVTFERMGTRRERVERYSVFNADPVNDYEPLSVKFTLLDDVLTDVIVYGKRIREDGSLATHPTAVPGIFAHNRKEWPSWLPKILAAMYADVAADTR